MAHLQVNGKKLKVFGHDEEDITMRPTKIRRIFADFIDLGGMQAVSVSLDLRRLYISKPSI